MGDSSEVHIDNTHGLVGKVTAAVKPYVRNHNPKVKPQVYHRTVEILNSEFGYSWVEYDKDKILLATSKYGEYFHLQEKAWEDYLFYKSLSYPAPHTVQLQVIYTQGQARFRAEDLRRRAGTYGKDERHFQRFALRPMKPR